MTESAAKALAILRDGSLFQWYVIPLLAFAFYVYNVEVEKRNWNLALAGLAFWGMDWFNEIWNALVFHFTGTAPVRIFEAAPLIKVAGLQEHSGIH